MNATVARQITQLIALGDPVAKKILVAAVDGRSKCSINFKSVKEDFLKEWRKRGFFCEVNSNALDCDCDWGCSGGCPVVTRVTFHWKDGYFEKTKPNYVLA